VSYSTALLPSEMVLHAFYIKISYPRCSEIETDILVMKWPPSNHQAKQPSRAGLFD